MASTYKLKENESFPLLIWLNEHNLMSCVANSLA